MGTVRQTHTYAELGLSKAAYDEISRKLREANYDHAFMEDGTIDMHGIGVTCAGLDEIDKRAMVAAKEIANAVSRPDALPGIYETIKQCLKN